VKVPSEGVTHVKAPLNESHMWRRLSSHTYEWVTHVKSLVSMGLWMSHTCEGAKWRRHTFEGAFEWVTHMNESHMWSRMYEWAFWREVRVCVTYVNQTCHTRKWVMSHMCMRHVTHTYGCHTHIWKMYATHRNKSCHNYDWGMSHIWALELHIWMIMGHVTQKTKLCHTYDSFICVGFFFGGLLHV